MGMNRQLYRYGHGCVFAKQSQFSRLRASWPHVVILDEQSQFPVGKAKPIRIGWPMERRAPPPEIIRSSASALTGGAGHCARHGNGCFFGKAEPILAIPRHLALLPVILAEQSQFPLGKVKPILIHRPIEHLLDLQLPRVVGCVGFSGGLGVENTTFLDRSDL
jgi:hypothetical protein